MEGSIIKMGCSKWTPREDKVVLRVAGASVTRRMLQAERKWEKDEAGQVRNRQGQ